MNYPPIGPSPSNTEFILASERVIVPESDEFRMRAVARARVELAQRLAAYPPRSYWLSKPRRKLPVALAAAAGVMLLALCAVAFRAGYRITITGTSLPAKTSAPKPGTPAPPVPAALPDTPTEASPAVTIPPERSSKAKVARRAKTPTDSETYAIELGLLEPAYHAVARGDFAAALAAIAEHQRHFVSGRLAEEREALRVKALLGLGRRAEAQRAASAFRERFPHSVLQRRIQGMLDASP